MVKKILWFNLHNTLLMHHGNLCCWDLKLSRSLYSKLKEGTGDPAIIIGISTVGPTEASYFIVLPLCSGGWHFRVMKFSWSLFSHESYGRINIFKNEDTVMSIALSCWSSRRSPKPFCGNKSHGLWDENEEKYSGSQPTGWTHSRWTVKMDDMSQG